MSEPRPKRDTMSLEETTISNTREIAAIVEALERTASARSMTSATSSANCPRRIPARRFLRRPSRKWHHGVRTLAGPALTHRDNVGWSPMKKVCLEANLDPQRMKRDYVQLDELPEEQWNSMYGC